MSDFSFLVGTLGLSVPPLRVFDPPVLSSPTARALVALEAPLLTLLPPVPSLVRLRPHSHQRHPSVSVTIASNKVTPKPSDLK